MANGNRLDKTLQHGTEMLTLVAAGNSLMRSASIVNTQK
jgi:hypothetical protein